MENGTATSNVVGKLLKLVKPNLNKPSIILSILMKHNKGSVYCPHN